MFTVAVSQFYTCHLPVRAGAFESSGKTKADIQAVLSPIFYDSHAEAHVPPVPLGDLVNEFPVTRCTVKNLANILHDEFVIQALAPVLPPHQPAVSSEATSLRPSESRKTVQPNCRMREVLQGRLTRVVQVSEGFICEQLKLSENVLLFKIPRNGCSAIPALFFGRILPQFRDDDFKLRPELANIRRNLV